MATDVDAVVVTNGEHAAAVASPHDLGDRLVQVAVRVFGAVERRDVGRTPASALHDGRSCAAHAKYSRRSSSGSDHSSRSRSSNVLPDGRRAATLARIWPISATPARGRHRRLATPHDHSPASSSLIRDSADSGRSCAASHNSRGESPPRTLSRSGVWSWFRSARARHGSTRDQLGRHELSSARYYNRRRS